MRFFNIAVIVALIMGYTSPIYAKFKSGYEGKVKYTTYSVASTNPAVIKKSLSKAKKKKGITYLDLPDSSKFAAPYPLVLVLPSSGGVNKITKYYAKEFTKLGFASAIVDPFKPRGMRSLGTSQSGISDASYVTDIFKSIEKLSEHPDLDMNRVATFGRSWGGGIQMYLTSKWWTDVLGNGNNPIKYYISLVPACYFTEENIQPEGGEMLVLFGMKDTWNEPKYCKRYLARFENAGGKVDIVNFPEGLHSFDKGEIKSNNVVTYNCGAVWNTETMILMDKQNNKEYNMAESGWDDYWSKTKCIKKQKVKYGGTKEQKQRTLSIVINYLVSKFNTL